MIYLQCNVLLAASFLLFFAADAFARRRGLTLSPRPWLRAAQALVVLSVVSPLLLNWIPAHRLPSPGFRVERLLDDWSAGPARASLSSAPVAARARPTRAPLAPGRRPFAASLLALIVAALLARRFAELVRLRAELRRAPLLRKIGRVRVVAPAEASVPYSALLGRTAWVAIPPAFVSGPARDLRLALRHELQHHRSRDTAWALASEALACVFFLNPAARAWRERVASLQEYACDEAVASRPRVSRLEYGNCLIRAAELARIARESARGSKDRVGVACMAAKTHDLRRRIEMLTERRKAGKWAIAAGFALAMTTAGLAYASHAGFREGTVNAGQAKLDPGMQAIAEQAVAARVAQYHANAGFVVVMEPSTGRVLAVASADPVGMFSDLGKDWPLALELEPASAAKGIVAAAAVEHGVVEMSDELDCENGTYQLGERTFFDYHKFYKLTAAETVIRSSNICGIKIGQKLGARGLETALADFGFGPKGSASAFPGARSGSYPAAGSIDDDSYIPMLSTGYADFHATSLEVLFAYGAIANGGNLLKPAGADSAGGTVVRRVLSEENSRRMRRVLEGAVLWGTGSNARSEKVSTAGKTSTAYAPSDRDHWRLGGEFAIGGFVGFAPADQPKIAVYAAIIEPHDRQVVGNGHAAPLFRDVVEGILAK